MIARAERNSAGQTVFVSSSSRKATIVGMLKTTSVLRREKLNSPSREVEQLKTGSLLLLTGMGVLSFSMFPNQSPTFHFFQPIGSGSLSAILLAFVFS